MSQLRVAWGRRGPTGLPEVKGGQISRQTEGRVGRRVGNPPAGGVGRMPPGINGKPYTFRVSVAEAMKDQGPTNSRTERSSEGGNVRQKKRTDPRRVERRG